MNPKNIDQINKKIGDINNDFQLVPSRAFDSMYNLKIDNFKMPVPDGLAEISSERALALKEAIEGTRSMDSLGEGLEKTAKDLVDKFGKKEIIDILSELEPLGKAGNLPDYPFKGNDWIDLAVKDIIKLADEGGYDRVAFTNAPTQIKRNRSEVDFVKDISVRRIPSLEEYAQSSQFKKDFDEEVKSRFENSAVSSKEDFLKQPSYFKNALEMNLGYTKFINPENTEADYIKNILLNKYSDEYLEKPNRDGIFVPKYEVEKRSLRIEDKPDYLLTSDSKLADLTSVDEGDFTYLETTDELLAEFPKKMHAQILKDIEAGNIPKSFDDAQIYELNFKEGSGKKYLDLYDSKLKGALKNVVKKLDKDNKPMIKNVLFHEEFDDVSPDILYQVYKGELGGDDQAMLSNIGETKSITIDITPKMKKTIAEEGVNVYAKGGIVKKLKSMDKPIAGNTRYV